MSKITIFGAGMVGSAMAFDLAEKHDVTVTDISIDDLNKIQQREPSIQVATLDVRDDIAIKNTSQKFRCSNLRCARIFGISNTQAHLQ